jgi:hypothetical protein
VGEFILAVVGIAFAIAALAAAGLIVVFCYKEAKKALKN